MAAVTSLHSEKCCHLLSEHASLDICLCTNYNPSPCYWPWPWSLSPWPWGWTFGPDFDLSTEPLITSLQINDKTVLIDAFVKFHLPLKWIYYLNRTSAMFFGRKNTKTHLVQKKSQQESEKRRGLYFPLIGCVYIVWFNLTHLLWGGDRWLRLWAWMQSR